MISVMPASPSLFYPVGCSSPPTTWPFYCHMSPFDLSPSFLVLVPSVGHTNLQRHHVIEGRKFDTPPFATSLLNTSAPTGITATYPAFIGNIPTGSGAALRYGAGLSRWTSTFLPKWQFFAVSPRANVAPASLQGTHPRQKLIT